MIIWTCWEFAPDTTKQQSLSVNKSEKLNDSSKHCLKRFFFLVTLSILGCFIKNYIPPRSTDSLSKKISKVYCLQQKFWKWAVWSCGHYPGGPDYSLRTTKKGFKPLHSVHFTTIHGVQGSIGAWTFIGGARTMIGFNRNRVFGFDKYVSAQLSLAPFSHHTVYQDWSLICNTFRKEYNAWVFI